MPQSQQKCTEELETNDSVPLQEKQPDIAEGKDRADYDLNIDYKELELKNESAIQEEMWRVSMQSMKN